MCNLHTKKKKKKMNVLTWDLRKSVHKWYLVALKCKICQTLLLSSHAYNSLTLLNNCYEFFANFRYRLLKWNKYFIFLRILLRKLTVRYEGLQQLLALLPLFEQDIQILSCAANTNKVNTLTDLVSKLTT